MFGSILKLKVLIKIWIFINIYDPVITNFYIRNETF